MKIKGFTLIEAAVSIAIFSVVAILLGQIMVISVQNQIKITYAQTLLNETGFLLDYISKDVRMAKRAEDSNCIPEGETSEIVEGGLQYLSYDAEKENYKCKKVYLVEDSIEQKVSSTENAANFPVNGVSLSSSSVQVNKLKFEIQAAIPATRKERVTIKIEAENKQIDNPDPVVVQTTIAPRN